jgi:hypothetical protein
MHEASRYCNFAACSFFVSVIEGPEEVQAARIFLDHGGFEAALAVMQTYRDHAMLQLCYMELFEFCRGRTGDSHVESGTRRNHTQGDAKAQRLT